MIVVLRVRNVFRAVKRLKMFKYLILQILILKLMEIENFH